MVANPISTLSDNVSVNRDKCLGCGECVDRCILDNLRLEQAPCGHACPLDINAQGYVQLIKRGKPEEALAQIYKKTPFVGLLGYLCHHPCERACNRNQVDGQGVSLRGLKRYLYETVPTLPDATVEHSVIGSCAVIGGGPAGLSAAWYLAKAGCQVTIFEAQSSLGGTPAQAIPAFRLPQQVLEQQCALVTGLGVEVRTGVTVGRDVSFEQLAQTFDAVFLATGAPKANRLPQAPDTLRGIHYALDFLRQVKGGKPPAVGRQVLVIGGGDVAVDAAQVAKRLGAEQVTMMSLEHLEELPASPEALSELEQEGIVLTCGWGVEEIQTKGDQVCGLKAKQCLRILDHTGAFSPCYDEKVQRFLEADMVILAIGQRADLTYLEESGIRQEGGRVLSDTLCRQTERDGVFAGGDCTTGSNTLAEALADGAKAAQSILRYLKGDDISYGRDNSRAYLHDFEVDLTAGSEDARVDLSARRPEEQERTMSAPEAATESGRCLGCGKPIGYRKTCWMCLPCEVQCPQDALNIKIHYIMA